MRVRAILKTALLALTVATMTPGHGQQPAARQDMPQVHASAGIRYMSGRSGTGDVKRIQVIAGSFNIRLRFLDMADGEALSGVTVVLANDKGERLLRLATEGSLLYLRLPPGRYHLAVIHQATGGQQWITVTRKPQALAVYLRVNAPEDDWLYCAGEIRLSVRLTA